MSQLDDALRRIENNNFTSQDASNLADFLKSKTADKVVHFRDISQDDIERIKLVSLLLSKKESLSNGQVQIDGADWRKIGEVFHKLKFILDDLSAQRTITGPSYYLGGGCFFQIVDKQAYVDFLYHEVKVVLQKVTDRSLTPITISVEKPSYETGENVKICGTLFQPSATTPVLLQILDPQGKTARIDTIQVQSTGSFSYEFRIGPTFKIGGIYKVLATYRTVSAKTSFSYRVTESRLGWQSNSINGIDFRLRFPGESATIRTVSFASGLDYVSLGINIYAQSDGTLEIEIPRILLDSKSASGTDEPLVVFIDEVEGDHKEVKSSADSRIIKIDFEAGSEQIEIIGTSSALRDPHGMEPIQEKISEHDRQFAEDLLLRHFSSTLVPSISYRKAAKIQSKNLSILFWDIRGFSQLTDELREYPNLVVKFLREYYHVARSIIYDEGGMLDKFMGDGVLAIFCYPTDDTQSTDDAVHAVSAALKMKERFLALSAKWAIIWNKNGYLGDVKIGLGCGINTGRVIFGRIGMVKNDQLTVIGSTVNLAKRLESQAHKGQILVSRSTWTHVKANFRFGKPAKRKLEGLWAKGTGFSSIE